MEKVHANIVVIGHGGSGKSATVAHFIYMLGGFVGLPIAISFQVAWTLGQLIGERARGTTIAIDKWKFETSKYLCILNDAPANHDFVKNMITGSSHADCAILVIDSTAGGFETGISNDGQVCQHALLARTLGAKYIICCCNKMDATTPKYSKARYDEIVKDLSYRLTMVGYNRDRIHFVPISGFEGDNLIERSTNLDWYKGPTLFEAIDQIPEPETLSDKPLRLPLLNVRQSGNEIVAVGRVETGILKAGMRVTFGPSGFKTKVKSLAVNEKTVQMASPGEIVSFTMKKLSANGLKCGYVASNSKKDPAKEAISFISQVNIMNNYEGQISKGDSVILDCHTSQDAVVIAEILHKIEPVSGVVLGNNPKFLKCGDAGLVKMVPKNPMVVEAFSEYPQLGCIVISDVNQTVAFGTIKSVKKKDTGSAMANSIAEEVAQHVGPCMCSILPMIVLQIINGGCLG